MRLAFHFSIALLFVFQLTIAQTNFSRITCGSSITLNIKQGDSCSYSSNRDPNSDNPNKMVFEIYNNTLHIEGGNYKDAVANVTVKDLKGLTVDGVTRVNFENTITSDELKLNFNGASKAFLKLAVNNLMMEADGASQIEMQGNCANGEIEINGASKVFAQKCIFGKCKVEANGASQCNIDSVTTDLKAEATGASKIYLKNIPEVYVASRSGLGKIYEGTESRDTTIQIDTKVVINDNTDSETHTETHTNWYNSDAGFNWTGLNLGFNGLLNTNNTLKAPVGYDFLEMNNASSIQIGLNLFEKDFNIYKHYVMGMVGAGFSWNNYKFSTQSVLQPHQPVLTAIKDTVNNLSVNKLRVSYFNVPVLIGFNTSQNSNKAFHVAAGVVVGVRMGGMVKTVSDTKDGKQHGKTFALYNTDQVRYDVMIRLKYKWANIWATYSLNGLFKKNQGPEVHPIAVGVNILEF